MTLRAELKKKATQTALAKLVGCSKQAISKQSDKGVLPTDGTLGEWLICYCDQLRTEAAGRSGEDQAALTKARTREAIATAQTKELQLYKDSAALVSADEVRKIVAAWATAGRAEFMNAIDKLAAAIKSEHNITLDQDVIDGIFDSAFGAVASYPEKFNTDTDVGGRAMDTAQAVANA